MNLTNKQKTTGARIRIYIVCALSLLLLPAQYSTAQSVEPMVFELEPLGSRSGRSLRIDNPSSSPLTVEITALTLMIDENGNETNTPADEDFLIYPPQTIIPADSTQVVKVKYIGEPTIDESRAYRIAITQLPVNLNESGGSNVSILTKFLTIANVSPVNSKPKLEITDIQMTDNKRWMLTVKNSGNRFGLLSNTTWELKDLSNSSGSKKLNNDEVNALISRSLILPQSTLHFSIPAIKGYQANKTKINLKLKKTS